MSRQKRDVVVWLNSGWLLTIYVVVITVMVKQTQVLMSRHSYYHSNFQFADFLSGKNKPRRVWNWSRKDCQKIGKLVKILGQVCNLVMSKNPH